LLPYLAAKQGDEDAKKALATLEDVLTSDQKAKAMKEARVHFMNLPKKE